VVLSEPVQLAHALSPTNDSERLLFRQFLDNLIRLDCQDKARPSIAQSWSVDSEGRVWTLTLRDGARMPGGTPVDALHVAALLGGPDGRAAGIDSAIKLDDRRVRVRLHEARDTAPAV
jgi:ABC-type transport system substrate-binding protein